MAKHKYTCIECGESATDLYTDFKGGVIRIEHCKACGEVVDKYVEYDGMIILLDIILHKRQAYRHILHNSNIEAPWRLLCVLLICDAYLLWDQERTELAQKNNGDDFIFIYAAMEWRFYKMFVFATLEWIVFCVCVISSYKALCLFTQSPGQHSWLSIIRSLVLSSFGKLLVIPATIWAQSHSPVYLVLTKIIILTSNTQALHVLCRMSRPALFVILFFANLAYIGLHQCLISIT